METKENRFFRVMSALMILGGATGMALGVAAVLGAGALAAALGSAANFGLLMVASIATWAGGVAGLIAGIIGVKSAVKTEKGIGCIVFGVLTAMFSAMGSILAVVGGGSFSMMNLLAGVLLPVLYLIGNKQK
ncbi:hypothetical protein LJC27_06245 [Christensenellaceae bacterium OttesenSCG-928-M15]|nr:hypothetical protein [Christensenellaceae bacterium OttesenSCG-928-M15]